MSVTTTAALLVTAPVSVVGGVIVSNRGPVSIFVGSHTVTADQTSTGGLEIAPGEKVAVGTLSNQALDLYAVTAAGTATVSLLVP